VNQPPAAPRLVLMLVVNSSAAAALSATPIDLEHRGGGIWLIWSFIFLHATLTYCTGRASQTRIRLLCHIYDRDEQTPRKKLKTQAKTFVACFYTKCFFCCRGYHITSLLPL
jgi:hypothetical protein